MEIVFKSLKEKSDDEFVVSFEITADTFEKAVSLKEKIEDIGLVLDGQKTLNDL